MKRILIIFFIGITILLPAQQNYNDAQLRTGLSLTKRVTKKFALHLDLQERMNDNVSNLYRSSANFGLSYKLGKYIRFNADYTYIERKNKEGFYMQRNWYDIGVTVKGELDRWKFIYRNLAQARMGNTNSDMARIAKLYDRNRIIIKHETTKRISLWAGGEVYIPLNSPSFMGIDRYRGLAGTTIKTFKGQNIDLYFMYQNYVSGNNWFDQSPNTDKPARHSYIYVVSYNIEF